MFGERKAMTSEAEEAAAAFEAGLAKIEARLRREHPELFDDSGRLRADEVSRLLIQRANGKTELTRAELLGLMGGRGALPSDAT